jgi:hypothetical protein
MLSLLFRLPFTLAEIALRQSFNTAELLLKVLRDEPAADPRAAAATPESVPARPDNGAPSAGAPQGASQSRPSGPGRSAAAPSRPGGRPATPDRQRPPAPSAEEAIARRRAREAASAGASQPGAAAEPAAVAPTGGADSGNHADPERELVESFGPADDVQATVTVDPPWEGYDTMAAAAVIERVRGADAATKAVVRLYESQHKKRRTVLKATGG